MLHTVWIDELSSEEERQKGHTELERTPGLEFVRQNATRANDNM